MRYAAVVLLCTLAFASEDLPGITGDLGQPVEVTGSVVHLVTSFPSEISWELEETEPAPYFEPPEEYDLIEILECRFIVPDKDGICPAVVSLSSGTILESSNIQLTAQAQQSVDLAPDWLQGHLIWKYSILTEANQDRYGALLLAHQGQNYYDELAFTVANLSWTILANPNWDETLLVDNAQGIYEHDSLLSYVNVNDYAGSDYYSTTEYNTIAGSDTVWVEIPREIYYNYVVMPKVSDERPLNDSSVYDEFWRQYLWDMDDEGYPIFNDVLNENVLVFWDEQAKNYGWSPNPTFTDSLHAVDILSKWTRAINPVPASGNRPIQPNVIAHEHNGNCGEMQDLLCAGARVALLPACCTMDINEDHVWVELWWNDEWHPWQPDWIDNPYVAYDYAYGGSKDCSCIWSWRNDGYTWDDIAIYTPACTFTVTVTDSAGIPVDNATVQIASEGWQTSTLYRGTWGQTDRNGQITFILGDNQNFYLNISSSLGNYGAGGYLEVITNSVANQDYYFEWSPPALMPELDMNELSEGSWTKYLIQVDYDLPVDIMNGRDYYANPRSEYAEPLEDGTSDFFIVDSANWDLYQAGEEFDCYEVIQGQSEGEIWFYAPHTDDWYIVFSGDRHQGLETFADATITLWEHDGTGISGGIVPAMETAIYPNPCVNQASVVFATAAAGNMEVTVYDIHGRVVETLCDELLEAGSHNLTLKTSEFSSGLYFVKFHGEGLNSMRSLTVLR
ncbi:MAG: T9SS type A sorting domain-containing protein [Candidatus Sabulitectum sp.]|nr:T9SS type A sorting domain-containing protein [Candidatus Sabulitectum sp.]